MENRTQIEAKFMGYLEMVAGQNASDLYFQKGTISAAFRLIPSKIKTLEELNLPPALYELTKPSQGFVLITGPCGHGKSTTLAALVDYINYSRHGHIIIAPLHTNDAAQPIDRIVDVFPAHQQNQIRMQLAQTLLGIVSQRLVNKVDGGRVPAVEILYNSNAVANLIREGQTPQINLVIETSSEKGM